MHGTKLSHFYFDINQKSVILVLYMVLLFINIVYIKIIDNNNILVLI